MKVWESPFIPSHLTFKKVRIHSLSNNQSNNQSIYLFIITFQNLEFWDVTNLPPLKGISSLRFGEARKKRLGFGGLLKIHRSSRGVQGATTLRSMVTVPSILIYIPEKGLLMAHLIWPLMAHQWCAITSIPLVIFTKYLVY